MIRKKLSRVHIIPCRIVSCRFMKRCRSLIGLIMRYDVIYITILNFYGSNYDYHEVTSYTIKLKCIGTTFQHLVTDLNGDNKLSNII